MRNSTGIAARYDVVIVGARCAGAATAMLLARAGVSVLVVDRQGCGTDTASTHALMRGAVLQLSRWGLLPAVMAAGTPAVRRSTFHYGDDAVGVDIRQEHGVDHLCAPRRTVLDPLLVDAARAAGAEVRHGVCLTNLLHDRSGRVSGVVLRDELGRPAFVDAGMVIGADGRQSAVARLAGAETCVEGRSSSGYAYGYLSGLPDDGFHWHFARGAAAGVIPTNHGQHCVFVAVPGDRFASTFRGDLTGGFLRVAEANSPALREALEGASLSGRLRGFAGGPGFIRQSFGPGWALVGDAACFKDPLTAHGITDALRDAEMLAQAVLDGRTDAFARYQDDRDALLRPLFEVTEAIASFDWDFGEARRLHGELSRAMKREVAHLAGLETVYAAAA